MPDKDLGIYGGAYCIPREKVNEFYKLYTKKIFVDKKHEYLTEVQLKGDADAKRPIVLDFDFRYESSITDRQHSGEHLTELNWLWRRSITSSRFRGTSRLMCM
jgi:hypothetical protein